MISSTMLASKGVLSEVALNSSTHPEQFYRRHLGLTDAGNVMSPV